MEMTAPFTANLKTKFSVNFYNITLTIELL